MSKNETWMTRKYWDTVGGLLIEEFEVVKGTTSNGVRRLDGLIILGEPKEMLKATSYNISEKDVICIQTKNSRLGMNVMGQAFFSRMLLELHCPKSIKSVILVSKNDSILIDFCNQYNIEVVIISEK